jgi:hypothetical protein
MRWFIGLGLAIWLLLGQGHLVSAQGITPCTMSAVTSSLEPKWVAVRQQYELNYQPINAQQVQTSCSRSKPASTLSASTLAPEWVVVRQQYEPGFQPVEYPQTTCSPLASQWVAVRQQYEPGYVPACQG